MPSMTRLSIAADPDALGSTRYPPTTEIRKQLELKKWLALAIPFGVWFGSQPMIRGILFGELTFANWAGSACVFGSVVMIMFVIVRGIFRRIENRRLQAEFPSEPSSDNETRNDVAAR
jgi:hypothetical protein